MALKVNQKNDHAYNNKGFNYKNVGLVLKLIGKKDDALKYFEKAI